MFGLAAAAASNAAPASNRTFGTTTPQAQAYDPATSTYLHALHRQADRLLPSDLDSGGGVGAGARVQINMDSLAQAMASGGEISYDDARQIVQRGAADLAPPAATPIVDLASPTSKGASSPIVPMGGKVPSVSDIVADIKFTVPDRCLPLYLYISSTGSLPSALPADALEHLPLSSKDVKSRDLNETSVKSYLVSVLDRCVEQPTEIIRRQPQFLKKLEQAYGVELVRLRDGGIYDAATVARQADSAVLRLLEDVLERGLELARPRPVDALCKEA